MKENTVTSMRQAIIADDNKTLREVLTIMIQCAIPGIEVDTVANGRDLVERVQNGDYEFVITDNNMPVMTGLQAIAEIRKYNQKIPICLSSSGRYYDGKSMGERAKEAGANDFLEKPFDSDALETIVKKYHEMRNLGK